MMNSYTETIEKGLSEANNVLLLSGNDQLEELRLAENTNSALERISKYKDMQEVSTSNEQKQCNNLETSNAIARGNTVHTDCHPKGYRACSLSFFIASWLLAVQTVGRAYAYSGKKLILVYFYLYICH